METADSGCELNGVRFDAASGVLTGAGATFRLEPKAADVLSLLLREQGTLVSRERLLDDCWGDGAGSDEALTQAIAQIRRAFEALGLSRDLLTTYPKRGYRLAGPTTAGERPKPRKSGGVALISLAVAAALLLAILIYAPHWPRHLIRHALGLGPNHGQHHSGWRGDR